MSKKLASLNFILVFCSLFPPITFSQTLLQKMLDETNNGDTLYIEKGNYQSDNSITLTGKKNLTLIFEEGATVTCSSQFQDIFLIQNCMDIQIYNGVFKHLLTEEASSFGTGFYLLQSQNIRITNAVIENNGITGVFAQSLTSLELTKCSIRNNSASAFLFQEPNKNIVLKGNQYEYNGADSIKIYEFKNNSPETDPFESIDERVLNERESNHLDSILRQQKLRFFQIKNALEDPTVPRTYYNSQNKQSLDPHTIETFAFPAWLEYSEKSGNQIVWLSLPDNVYRYLCDASGLARFDTRDANEFFKYDEPAFTNISPKTFLKSVRSDVIHLNEALPTNIHWNCDPELEQMVLELKNKSLQQIADAQETVIYRLLQVWEKYQTANLLYEKFHFELVGNCRFQQTEYNAETELLDVHLSLNDCYLATMRVPMKASVAKQLFFNRTNFTVYFTMQVHPGFKQISFQSDIKNTVSWTLPNLEPISDPSIECMNQLGLTFRFKAHGLLGKLWPDGYSKRNWDKACPTPANRSYQNLLLGGLVAPQSNETISVAKNNLINKPSDVINRIVLTMEFYSKSMGDCYFGLSNNAKKLMEGLFPAELKDKQYLIFTLVTQADIELVKKALIAKGMHFADSYDKGQIFFCYTRQLK